MERKYALQQNIRFVLQCFYKRRETKETWADCPSFFFQIKRRRNGKFFHSPRKVTGQNLDKFKVPCKCDRSDYKYQPVTAEGELTLEGVYEQFLLDMQNDRHWAKSTWLSVFMKRW